MKIAYDLHLHSCLSLCAEDDCTPAAIAGMAMLAGIEAFALADHQSARNCPAAARAAEAYGLIFVPGMELCTSEEVHVLCLFETVEGALAFSDYVAERLMIPFPRKRLDWRQTVMDEHDQPIAEEERWLGSPADIGIYDVAALVQQYGGLAIPAHIDRPSSSLLANLGLYDPGMGFCCCEITPGCDAALLREAHPELEGMPFIRNSDAHELASIPDAAHHLEVAEASAKGILDALRELRR